MKAKLFYNIFNIFNFILILSISYCNNYIIFPLQIKNQLKQLNKDINSVSDYIDFIKNNQVSTNILIGKPLKKLELYLTSDRYDFILGEGFCILNSESDYNSSLSLTYQKTYSSYSSPNFINGILSKDNITLFNNINLSQRINFPEAYFIKCNPSSDFFDVINNNSFCGYLGLQIGSSSNYFEWHSIIHQLKSGNYIPNQKWSIIFNKNDKNNYDGKLIIGMKEEDYNNIFNLEEKENNIEYHSVYSINSLYSSDFVLQFDEIYYSINNLNYTFNKFIQGMFIIDFDFIVSNEYYFNSIKNTFFSKYIENGICFIDKTDNKRKRKKIDNQILNIILCDKKKINFDDIKTFPKLNLKHVILNEIFELDYEDLFEETKNYYIFKICFDEEHKSIWNFGRLFFKKYLFIFDNDQKTITYLGKNNNRDNCDKDGHIKSIFGINKEYILIIVIILIICFAVIIGLFLGKIIFNKQKKKRANELDDDYEYIEKDNNKNEGLGIKFNEND